MGVRVRVGEDVCVGCMNPVVVIWVVGAMLIAICLEAVDSACGEGRHGPLATGRHLPDLNAFAPLMLVNVPVLLFGEGLGPSSSLGHCPSPWGEFSSCHCLCHYSRSPAYGLPVSRLIPYTSVPSSDLATRGSRRHIALIDELPTELIASNLTNLPHHGSPFTYAPYKVVAAQKPTNYQNGRIAARHRTTTDKITNLHNIKPGLNKTCLILTR